VKDDSLASLNRSPKTNVPLVKDRHLRGIWLWLVRIGFVGIYAGLLYYYIRELIGDYAGKAIQPVDIFIIVITACIAIIAFFVFIRKSDDWFVVFSALALFLFPIGYNLSNDFSIALIGLMVFVVFSYLFPDGRFAPKWMRATFAILVLLTLLLIWAITVFADQDSQISSFIDANSFYILAGLLVLFFLGAVYSQVFRYRYVSTLVERQQTKWVAIGVAGFLVYLILTLIVFVLQDFDWFTTFMGAGLKYWTDYIDTDYTFLICYLLFSVTVLLAVYGYRLWDVDFYLNRTLLYGVVTSVLAIVWAVTIALLGYVIKWITDQQDPLVATVLSSIQVAALFQPVRQRTEKWINHRFYKDRIDFDEALVELQRDNWQFISSEDMFKLLATKVPRLLKSIRCAIYGVEDLTFHVVSSVGIDQAEAQGYLFDEDSISVLKNGDLVRPKEEEPFALLVPLVVPRQHVNDLIGVLALGPRVEDRGYSRDHLTDLEYLGERAGTAIHFLQLNERKNASR
jgi:hypothetical protein